MSLLNKTVDSRMYVKLGCRKCKCISVLKCIRAAKCLNLRLKKSCVSVKKGWSDKQEHTIFHGKGPQGIHCSTFELSQPGTAADHDVESGKGPVSAR